MHTHTHTRPHPTHTHARTPPTHTHTPHTLHPPSHHHHTLTHTHTPCTGYIEIKRSGWASFSYHCYIGGKMVLESTGHIEHCYKEVFKVSLQGIVLIVICCYLMFLHCCFLFLLLFRCAFSVWFGLVWFYMFGMVWPAYLIT